MTTENSIMTSTTAYVKQLAEGEEKAPRQQRIARGDIPAADVDPTLKALGRHIAGCARKGKSVRVPSMRCSEWGHVLRALELTRAIA
ncbi:ydfB protein [Serratia plymuthica A30]|nr:ydfB protein [Serratia plymuthica A30]